MRVDHLEMDELVFEVSIRGIVIRDDPTYSRRRRSLRESLKVEKEEKSYIQATIEDRAEEMGLCEKRFKEICDTVKHKDRTVRSICKTRLLHYGHRVLLLLNQENMCSEEHIFLKTLLVDIVFVLLTEFYMESVSSNNNQLEVETELALNHLFGSTLGHFDAAVAQNQSDQGNNSSTNIPQSSSTELQKQPIRISSLCTEDKAWIVSL